MLVTPHTTTVTQTQVQNRVTSDLSGKLSIGRRFSIVEGKRLVPHPTQYAGWVIQQGVDQGLRIYPSLDPSVQQNIARKYRALNQRVLDKGLYNCPYKEYAIEMVRYLHQLICRLPYHLAPRLVHDLSNLAGIVLGPLCLFAPQTAPPNLTLMCCATQHQIMFTAHDAGHRAISQNFVVDTLIGMFVADFCCGLSIGWWKSSHNVHHLVTNQPGKSPRF